MAPTLPPLDGDDTALTVKDRYAMWLSVDHIWTDWKGGTAPFTHGYGIADVERMSDGTWRFTFREHADADAPTAAVLQAPDPIDEGFGPLTDGVLSSLFAYVLSLGHNSIGRDHHGRCQVGTGHPLTPKGSTNDRSDAHRGHGPLPSPPDRRHPALAPGIRSDAAHRGVARAPPSPFELPWEPRPSSDGMTCAPRARGGPARPPPAS